MKNTIYYGSSEPEKDPFKNADKFFSFCIGVAVVLLVILIILKS
jgi:hypothetical protein